MVRTKQMARVKATGEKLVRFPKRGRPVPAEGGSAPVPGDQGSKAQGDAQPEEEWVGVWAKFHWHCEPPGQTQPAE